MPAFHISSLTSDPIVIIDLIVLAVILTAAAWTGIRVPKFRKNYSFDGPSPGRTYQCRITSSDAENPFMCRIGADEDALYILAPSADVGRQRWRTRLRILGFRLTYRKDLRLPWAEVQWRFGAMFGSEVIYFENLSQGFRFCVPREVGERILGDIKRPIEYRES